MFDRKIGRTVSSQRQQRWEKASVANWQRLLDSAIREEELRDFREHVRTGCPLGNAVFVGELERTAGRILRPQKAGRPLKLLKHP